MIGASLRMMTTHADGPSSFAIQEESRSQGATDDEGGGWRSDQKASIGIGTLSECQGDKVCAERLTVNDDVGFPERLNTHAVGRVGPRLTAEYWAYRGLIC